MKLRTGTFFVITILTVVGFSSLIPSQASAQASGCLSFNLSVKRTDEELRQLLAVCEKESKETEAQLKAQQTKSSTIASDVTKLQSLIKQSEQQISIKNQIIGQLSKQIGQKQQTITTLSTKLDRERESLGQIIRKKNEVGLGSFAEAFLTNQSISELFLDIDQLQIVNRSLQESLDTVRGVRVQTEEEKKDLEARKIEQANLKNKIEEEKRQTDIKRKDTQVLLNQSKSEEKTYQQLLAEKQSRAASIRNQLFELAGGAKPGEGIPFGEAYKYAKEIGQKTGIRPAFILAVLTQESNLGKNVGTCNRPGDPESKSWKKIMPGPHADRTSNRDDQSAFLRIIARLGLKAEGQPLSCPLPSGGWGGAMGPSQFIPTTWEMYDNKIEAALGVAVANPWNPRHAISATALYMKDLGAQDLAKERDAACRYYSGRVCTAPGVQNAFYGNSVVALANKIQKDIDVLESVN